MRIRPRDRSYWVVYICSVLESGLDLSELIHHPSIIFQISKLRPRDLKQPEEYEPKDFWLHLQGKCLNEAQVVGSGDRVLGLEQEHLTHSWPQILPGSDSGQVIYPPHYCYSILELMMTGGQLDSSMD